MTSPATVGFQLIQAHIGIPLTLDARHRGHVVLALVLDFLVIEGAHSLGHLLLELLLPVVIRTA
jgi:hypothetical protein